jgi:PAS domain S-box-containing protein
MALVAVALVTRRWLGDALGHSVPYLLFFPAVILAALYGGFGPGLVATLSSAAAAGYWFLAGFHDLTARGSGEPLSCILFIVMGTLVARLTDGFRRADMRHRLLAERLSRQYRALPIPTYTYEWTGADFVLIDLNDAASALSHRMSTLLGMTVDEICPDRPDVRGHLTACLQEQGVCAREIEYLAPGAAQPRYLISRYSFAPPNLVIVHEEDVTARHLAELAQVRLAAIVESSDDVIIANDLNGLITSWNRSAERVFGYSAAEAIGQPIALIIPADRREEEHELIAAVRDGRLAAPFETVRVGKTGRPVDVSIALSPIRNAAGGIVGVSTIVRDIAERRRAESIREELLRRETGARAEAVAARDRLAFLAEVSALLATSLDYEETVDRAVHLALPRLGDYSNVLVQDESGSLRHVASGHVVSEKESIVRDVARRIFERGADAPTFAEEVMKRGRTLVLANVDRTTAVPAAHAPDPDLALLAGQLRARAYVGAPLTVRGRVVGVLSFGRTVQESNRDYADVDVALIEEFARRVSFAIENARLFRQADELNRLKDEFLATLSHELRTPLSAVLGWSRMLMSPQLDEAGRRKAIEAIARNAQAQAKLVDNILDVARGMAGNLRLDLARTDLVAIAARGMAAITPEAEAKRIHLEMRAAGEVVVVGDPSRLQQVVFNLLSNAVKFTPRNGHVRVEVDKGSGAAELRVIDSGIGIPPAFLPHAFDKFRQADASFTREHGGLGLGLAITRHLVELHGGTVEALSGGEGRGATFVIRVPLAPALENV